jgi:cytochrome P450
MDFDPQSHELQDDPYPVYRTLPDTHPVFYSPQGRFWAISRYDDVLEALGRPRCFPRAGLSASPRRTTRRRTCR